MSKRKEKKAEEQKIIAEMQASMKEKTEAEEASAQAHQERMREKNKWYQDKTPEILHCRRCKSVMENGVCPTCGFRMYVPMDKEKQKKIRMILGCVCLIVFAILFVWTQAR